MAPTHVADQKPARSMTASSDPSGVHWPPPTGPAVGWYEGSEGRRYFDGRHWSEPMLPAVPLSVGLSSLGILALSLLLSRASVVALEPLGLPAGVLIALLILMGYAPPAWWCFRVVRRVGGTQWRSSIGWSIRPVDLGWGLLTWLCAVVTQAVLLAVLVSFDVPVASNAGALGDDGLPRWYLVATAMAAVVAAPVVEELVFRGVVLSALRSRMGGLSAVVVQGLIFGAVHADPMFGWSNLGLMLVLGSVGMVFGLAVHLTGRVGTAIIAHAVFNGVVLAVVFSGLAAG